MEIWLGHVVNLFQLNPECLAMLSAVYRFCDVAELQTTRVWPSVRAEMRNVLGVLFLLEVNLAANFSKDVVCGDSSTDGYALHVTKATGEEIRLA